MKTISHWAKKDDHIIDRLEDQVIFEAIRPFLKRSQLIDLIGKKVHVSELAAKQLKTLLPKDERCFYVGSFVNFTAQLHLN